MRTQYRDTTVRTTTATSWQMLCRVEPGQAATIRCRVECNWSPGLPEFELCQTPEEMLGVPLGGTAGVSPTQSPETLSHREERIYWDFEASIAYPDVPVALFFRSSRSGVTVEVSQILLEWDPDDNKRCECSLLFKDHMLGCPQMDEAVRKLRALAINRKPTIWDRLLDPSL